MAKNNLIIGAVLLLTLGALIVAVMLFFEKEMSMAVYNMGRALVFSWLSFYLLLRPEKIDLLGALKIVSSGNASPSNIKVAKVVTVVLAVFNISISLALYFD